MAGVVNKTDIKVESAGRKSAMFIIDDITACELNPFREADGDRKKSRSPNKELVRAWTLPLAIISRPQQRGHVGTKLLLL